MIKVLQSLGSWFKRGGALARVLGLNVITRFLVTFALNFNDVKHAVPVS